MADHNHLTWLKDGVEKWNERRDQETIHPDFDHADIRTQFQWPEGKSLDGINFKGASFRYANLSKLSLRWANLESAQLHGCNLSGTDLRDIYLHDTDLTNAILLGAKIEKVDFRTTPLVGVDMTGAFPWKSILFQEEHYTVPHDTLPEDQRSIDSVQSLLDLIEPYYKNNENPGSRPAFYFRGEGQGNWTLTPSVMRPGPLRSMEGEMLLDLMSRRPEDFDGASSALSQWVLAQQHGLKTRLLDVTRNPLVALFHCCAETEPSDSDGNMDGAFHMFAVPKRIVKRFDSDAISVVANFAKLSRLEQDILLGKEVDPKDQNEQVMPRSSNNYRDIMQRLYNYIGNEKPHFKRLIDVRDLFRVFVIEPQKTFERIRSQSGAFLLSAFHEMFEKTTIRRHVKNVPIYEHCKLKVPTQNKEKILLQLKSMNITRETLFPGLDEVAKAVVDECKTRGETL